MTATRPSRRDRGQVLPLFALFIVVLLAFAALAIDVSGALSARRYYRSVADAAALAGAQDLQQPDSRTVLDSDRIRARQDAMASLTTELGITGTMPTACSVASDADVTSACVLPGTTFAVSIRAGVYPGQPIAIACQDCDPARSVQVGLANPGYQLTFARLLGQSTWNVGTASVAGLAFGKSYAIQTLRPPKANGSIFLVNDIEIDGGSVVNVQHGDVGTNANMDYSGSGSILNLDPGYGMYYFDPASVPGWIGAPAPPAQIVQKLPTLMADPNYTYPAMRGSLGSASCSSGPANCAPTFADARESICGAPGPLLPCSTPALDPACQAEITYLATNQYTFMATQDPTKVYCYKPGIYSPSSPSRNLTIGPGDVVLLMPGAYYFKSPNGGVSVGGRLLGGYRPAPALGVALMFDECSNQCTLKNNSAVAIALNAGTKFPPGTAGTAAAAAVDWNGQPVMTSGPSSPTPPLLMTLLVTKDPSCFVPTTMPFQEPIGCDPGTHDKTLNMAGGGSLALEGVQYAPTDNIEIHGGSLGNGQVGQIIAWTIFYSGGTHINQEGPANQGPGTLRLDAACTAPGTPCNN